MRSFQSSLHSGGPNFKASLYPSTNCSEAAKVSVGVRSYLQACFLCPFFHEETLPKKELFLLEQVGFFLVWGECCFYSSLLKRTHPLFFPLPPLLLRFQPSPNRYGSLLTNICIIFPPSYEAIFSKLHIFYVIIYVLSSIWCCHIYSNHIYSMSTVCTSHWVIHKEAKTVLTP